MECGEFLVEVVDGRGQANVAPLRAVEARCSRRDAFHGEILNAM